MTDEHQVVLSGTTDETLVDRDSARRVLLRAGFAERYITEVLGGLTFPAPMSAVLHRGGNFGISAESLMDRLGASP